MICASANRYFTPDLPFRMIGLSTEVLLKMGGTSHLLDRHTRLDLPEKPDDLPLAGSLLPPAQGLHATTPRRSSKRNTMSRLRWPDSLNPVSEEPGYGSIVVCG